MLSASPNGEVQTNITTLRIPLRVYHGYLACDEGTAPCEEISINIGAVPVRGEKRVLVQSKALSLDLDISTSG